MTATDLEDRGEHESRKQRRRRRRRTPF